MKLRKYKSAAIAKLLLYNRRNIKMRKLKYAFLLIVMMLLTSCNNAGADKDNAATIQSSVGEMGVVNTGDDALKVRKDSNDDAEVVALLKNGEKVQILSEENEFYEISVETSDDEDILRGYVKKEYIDID